jgi:hypothetical protein
MLELGPRELLTLGTVLTGLAATYGVIKTTIKSLSGQIEEIKELDLDVQILAPQILKKQSERDGSIDTRLNNIEIQIDRLYKMHNGKHPSVERTEE